MGGGMKLARYFLYVFALAFSLSARAQVYQDYRFIPVAGGPGAGGSFWTTSLAIVSTVPVPVTWGLYEVGPTTALIGPYHTGVLDEGQFANFPDLLTPLSLTGTHLLFLQLSCTACDLSAVRTNVQISETGGAIVSAPTIEPIFGPTPRLLVYNSGGPVTRKHLYLLGPHGAVMGYDWGGNVVVYVAPLATSAGLTSYLLSPDTAYVMVGPPQPGPVVWPWCFAWATASSASNSGEFSW